MSLKEDAMNKPLGAALLALALLTEVACAPTSSSGESPVSTSGTLGTERATFGPSGPAPASNNPDFLPPTDDLFARLEGKVCWGRLTTLHNGGHGRFAILFHISGGAMELYVTPYYVYDSPSTYNNPPTSLDEARARLISEINPNAEYVRVIVLASRLIFREKYKFIFGGARATYQVRLDGTRIIFSNPYTTGFIMSGEMNCNGLS
jgi:hypothetical protein